MVNFDFKKHCYGCSACANICPQNAIQMIQNKEGFYNPEIDINKCIECGLCEKKCIYLKQYNKKEKNEINECYAMQLKDKKDIMKSSSGGVFYELAKIFIKEGGFVCGCIWDDNMAAKHIVSNNFVNIQKMRGSKYVQSNINSVYKEIKEILNKNKKIFFTGTPCQVQALKEVVGENNNLYTCSLICEGVPSPLIWEKYKKYFEIKQNSKLIKVNFRDKEKIGWNAPIIRMEFENGKKIENLSYNLDTYISSFISGNLMNSSCYECKLKNDNINSDLIIGDFWGFKDKENIPFYKKYGVSAVIIKTKKGKLLFNNIKDKYFIKRVEYNEISKNNPNLEKSIEKTVVRDKIYEEIKNQKDDINNILLRNSNLKTLKKKIIKILYKTNLFKYFRM